MKSRKIISDLVEKIKVTRRSFIKGALAIGAANTVYGCSKEGIEILGGGGSLPGDPIEEVDLSNPQIYTATCPHNCGTGTRCVSHLHVVNGKIVRVTSDESDVDFEGNKRDKNWLNDSRALNCAKGRSSKYKVHHPGRLKYPLKQTLERGNVAGFIRMNSEAMMKEVATKTRAVYKKYGRTAITRVTASSTGYSGKFSRDEDAVIALSGYVTGNRDNAGDYSYHQYHFGRVLTGHPGIGYAYDPQYNIGWHLPHVAGVVKNVVSFGSNATSTNNSVAWPYIRSMEKLKARGGKVYFIGPELTDTVVTCATDWVQLRNYTDAALIMAMFHEMIINTFKPDGTIMEKPWLDVAYLDTMVHGFFDSPEYWVHVGIEGTWNKDTYAWDGQVSSTGVISFVKPTANTAEYRKINAVPAGKSLSAYVMGNDDRLTKATYDITGATATYASKMYNSKQPKRNLQTCQYTAILGDESKYMYKKDLNSPKTPEWAEAICGTPAATITKLAKMYCDPAEHPIFTEWAGGVQKQDNGVVNIFSIGALLCVTKTFGLNGEGLFGPWAATIDKHGDNGEKTSYINTLRNPNAAANVINTDANQLYIPENRPAAFASLENVPTTSCKEWFNGMKFAYYDELKKELGSDLNKFIPEWDMADRFVNDNAGAKAGVKYSYADSPLVAAYPKTYTDTDSKDYYDYDGRGGNTNGVGVTPTYSGLRMIFNSGGNMPVNQHMNSNDLALMYKTLPVSGDPDNADRFCLVTFDPFLAPSARYSDYVFPATVVYEAGDWTEVGGEVLYRPAVVKAPGETKDGWRYAYEAYKAQADLGDLNDVTVADAHFKYVGTATTGKAYRSAEVLSLELVDKARASNSGTRFASMTREEVYASQYLPRKNVGTEENITATGDLNSAAHGKDLRVSLDTYLAKTPAERVAGPFVKLYPHDLTAAYASIESSHGGREADIAGGYEGRPEFTGKFHVYNETLVWDYTRRYSKWHGHLPVERRGQTNKDYEGDPIVYPIPMYFNFEDSFNESYGVFNGKPNNDVTKKKGLTLSTTHDRYRVHSSNAENPLLRELNHRTAGGKWLSGNDWKEYSVMPERHPEGGTAPISSRISTAIANANSKTASWHEIWISSEDSGSLGVVDGDLVEVSNPIGKIRCVARVTNRCVKGTANLHQGAWYDPSPVDGVDDGACANTLMSSKSSRIDNGNAQQSAYVYIKKTDAPTKQTK